MTNKFLRRPDVQNLTGLSRSSIYQKIKDGDFPKPIKLSERTVAWLESDLVDWMNSKVAASKSYNMGL